MRNFDLSDERVVAYSFSLDGSMDTGGIGYQVFTSSEDCRSALRYAAVPVQVIVAQSEDDIALDAASGKAVTPINLAAALCKDTPGRDVYLMAEQPSGSMTSRAQAAGLRGFINKKQAASLLGLAQPASAHPMVINPEAEPVQQVVGGWKAEPVQQVAIKPEAAPAVGAVAVCERPVQAPLPIAATPSATILSVVSGRGGVGKSTIALLLGVVAQLRGLRVALVEMDTQFGDMGFLLGHEPEARITQINLERVCGIGGLPSVQAGELLLVDSKVLPEQAESIAEKIPTLLDNLTPAVDLVVINTGSFWTEVQARLAGRSKHLLFLMDQRASSIDACVRVVDLCIRLQIASTRFAFALNRCGSHAPLTTQDAALALGGVDVCALADGGALVDELLSLGCPYELVHSGNPLVVSIEQLLDALEIGSSAHATGSQIATGFSAGKRGGFSRLQGLFGRGGHVTP
ncbi:MAG: P-loop NTPase [Coriobacteriales bacterium]|nr:P-loop NTPase [Coriobacteriales bacterium]